MRKEYMGEIAIPCIDWFNGGDVKLWSDDLPVSLVSHSPTAKLILSLSPDVSSLPAASTRCRALSTFRSGSSPRPRQPGPKTP